MTVQTFRALGQQAGPALSVPAVIGWTIVVGIAVAVFSGTINLRTGNRIR